MAVSSGWNRTVGNVSRHPGIRFFSLALFLTGALFPVVAGAQEAAGNVPLQATQSGPACYFRTVPPANSAGLPMLHASCGGVGLVIGPADDFRSFDSPALKGALVETVSQGLAQVYLLLSGGDGSPILENITSIVAVTAGRTPTASLEGLSLDYAGLADRGVITIRSAASPEGRAPALDIGSEVDLAEHLELERQRSWANGTGN